MTSLRKRLGKRLRELRSAEGLTQKGLAAESGHDYRYIGAVERGEINITVDSLEKILRGLGASHEDLFRF